MAALQESFAAELRRLHQAAGSPSYQQIADRSGVGKSTVGDLLTGKFTRAPKWDFVLAVVEACVALAPLDAQPAAKSQGVHSDWRRRHGDLERALQQTTAGVNGAARGTSAQRELAREIMPTGGLTGRADDLAGLHEFLDSAGDYLWIRARPYAGVSARSLAARLRRETRD